MTTTQAVGASTPPATGGKSAFGGVAEQKDMFLQLLVAQLRNQDPSSPMDQKDMMAQMAQFTSVEQMTNMVKALESLSFNASFAQSVGLIGKSVTYAVGNGTTSELVTSTVTSVSTASGVVKLDLANGQTITPSEIAKVRDA